MENNIVIQLELYNNGNILVEILKEEIQHIN